MESASASKDVAEGEEGGTLFAFARRLLQRPGLSIASLTAFAVYAGGAGLSYLAQGITAVTLGAHDFGIYTYALAWATLLGYLLTLGFHVSLMRFVPAYLVTGKPELARGIVRFAHLAILAAGLAILAFGCLGLLFWRASLDPDLFWAFVFALPAAPVLAFLLIRSSLVRAFGGVASALFPERVAKDGIMLGVLLLLVGTGTILLTAGVAMATMLFGLCCALLIATFSMNRLYPKDLSSGGWAYASREWAWTMAPITVMTIADAFITRSGTMLLGMVGDTRGAGIYSLSFSMAMLVALPRVAVNTMFAPTVAHLHASGDAQGLQAMLVKASGLSLAGALMVAIPLWLSLDLLLTWLGAEFQGAREIVSILVLGQVFAAAAGPQEDLFTMTGNERAGAALLVASAIAVFVLGYILVGRYAETGAAVAASLVLVGWNIGMAVVIYRRIGLVPGLIMGLREFIRNGQKNPGL